MGSPASESAELEEMVGGFVCWNMGYVDRVRWAFGREVCPYGPFPASPGIYGLEQLSKSSGPGLSLRFVNTDKFLSLRDLDL